MTSKLSFSERQFLVPIAADLYAGKEPTVDMDAVPVQTRNKLYERLWEVMGKPDEFQYGERAFSDGAVSKKRKNQSC